jgi:cysteine desulfuration protein SufE
MPLIFFDFQISTLSNFQNTIMTINEIQEEIIEEFALFEEPMERYDYLIDIGKKLPELEERFKIEENVVKGCQSTVWLHSFEKDGNVYFEADSNTVITKGIVGLLVRVLSGHAPQQILDADLYFIDKIELRSHLSSQRSNGLSAMMKQIKLYAVGFSQQAKQA